MTRACHPDDVIVVETEVHMIMRTSLHYMSYKDAKRTSLGHKTSVLKMSRRSPTYKIDDT